MTNLPFNTNQNVPNLQQQMVGQPLYCGYNQQYNPPPPTITFSIIEGRRAGAIVLACLCSLERSILWT